MLRKCTDADHIAGEQGFHRGRQPALQLHFRLCGRIVAKAFGA